MKNVDLIIKIETLRKKMISVGLSKGFTSPETIKLSETLDKLLNIQMGILLMFFALILTSYKYMGILNLHLIIETLKSTKYFTYFIIAISTIINLVVPSYHLENKYDLISMYVIVVSLLEGITGFYELYSNSKSKS